MLTLVSGLHDFQSDFILLLPVYVIFSILTYRIILSFFHLKAQNQYR